MTIPTKECSAVNNSFRWLVGNDKPESTTNHIQYDDLITLHTCEIIHGDVLHNKLAELANITDCNKSENQNGDANALL